MSKRIAAPYIKPEQLEVGSAYFTLDFLDDAMLVPLVSTYYYVGSEIEDGSTLFLFRSAAGLSSDDAPEEIVAFQGYTGVKELAAIISDLINIQADWSKSQSDS